MSDPDTRKDPAVATEYERLFDLSLDLMAVGSFDGYLLRVNPAWTTCLGWSAAELVGRPWMELVHPDDGAATKSFVETLLAGLPVRAFENRYLHKDGSSRWLSWSALADAESRQIFAVGRDVTEQKQHLERRQQNERLLRMAGATAKLGGWSLVLADGKATWSDEVCAIHEVAAGFRPEVGAAIEFYASESRPEITRVFTECVEHGTPFVVELEIITARGNRRWVRAMGEAVRDAADRIVSVQGAVQDITDRRQAEVALRASEARFRTVIQSSWDVFHLVGGDGTILYESPAVTRVLGYQPEEMEGRSAFEFVHPDDAAEVAKTLTTRPPSGGSHVKILRVRHKDGSWRWVESFEVNLLDHPDVGAFAVNYRDITDRKEAEESMRASEERFRAMANSMSQLAWIATADGAIHWYNERWYEYTGATPAEMAGWGWQRVHDPERLPAVLDGWKTAIAAGSPVELEFPIRGADGHYRRFLTRVVPVRNADGQVVQWFGTNTDVEGLKRVEASLRESEASLKTAQRIAGLGSWELDFVTGELRWSDEVFRLFGISRDGFDGTYETFLRGVHPEDRERIDRAVKASLAGAPYQVEHRTLAPDGTVRTLLEQGEVRWDAAGRPVHMAGTVLDITQRRLAEFDLAETNRALRLLSGCNEAVTRSESENELLATVCRIAVDEGGFQMAWVGYAADDEAGTVVPRAHAGAEDGYLGETVISWSDASALGRGPVGRAIRGGEPVAIADLSAEPSFAPWLDAARARGFRSKVALPLKHADTTLGVLVLYLPEVRVLKTQELRVLRDLADDLAFGIVNLRGREETRRLQTALQKMATSVSASTGAQFFEQLAASMAEALGAEAAFVARFVPDSDKRARVIAAVVDDRAVPAFELDLAGTPAARVMAVEACIVSTCDAAVFGGTLSHVSRGTRGYAGRRLDDSTGQPMGFVFVLFPDPVRSTEFVTSTLQIFATRAAAELERQKAEVRLREQASLLDKSQDAILVRDLDHKVLYWNKSAERRYGWTAAEAHGRSACELIYNSDDLADFESATAATLARGEWVGELRHRHKDGSPVAVEGRWTLVRDDGGVPRSIMAVNTDLTERKKLERTEDQLRQAQKMEAVGSLAGGVAHDFNNLLSVILSYTDLIIADLPPADPIAVDLEEVKQAGLRATELTRQLLAFSRKQILEPVVLDLNQVVGGVTRMLGRLLGEDIDLSISTAAVASRVFADAGQVEQVLMNLVVNARDAMPRGGNLSIETANVDLDSSFVAEHVGAQPGPYVMLAVSDTGHGMDRATRERIFEPFFTTKDKSKGTGLGLSTVYGIVQQSGGHIWVYSELGVGTTIKVYLPQSDREVPTPAISASTGSMRGAETILLVEDEEQVRVILRTILRRQGYHVLEAQNGGEAFLVCEQFPAKIHLLLTDVVMPRMSGRQLAERLAPLRPEMKILYVSGYTEDTIVHHGVLDAGIEFLAKPIMPDALLRKVRSVLDGTARG